MIDLEYPQFMSEAERKSFLKVWESCIPKFTNNSLGIPIIYGTGGKIDNGTIDFDKFWYDSK